MYYNTNQLSAFELLEAIGKAETQEEAVLKIFQKHKRFTASDVWKWYGRDKCPLTSIRRAITDLCNEGRLVKCTEMKEGLYGKPEHYYRLV